MAGLTLVTPPATEPVTLAEAKLFLRIDTVDDDALVTELVGAARKRLENWRGLAFITQTWDYFLDYFPRRDAQAIDPVFTPIVGYVPAFPAVNGFADQPITLPRSPLISVGSVKYTPYTGGQLTMSAGDYSVDAANLLAPRIMPNIGKMWPADFLQAINGVVVRFDAGYGAAAANVPEQLKLAIKELVAYWYENRDAISQDDIPRGIQSVLLEIAGGGFTYA